MKLAGVNASEISVSSEVSRAVQTTVEVAMVLDYSWSMTENNKYSRMAQAAREMVDSIASRVASASSRSASCHFPQWSTPRCHRAMSRNPAGPRRGRAARRDRNYPHNQDIVPPTWNNDTKWGYYDPTENSGSYDCGLTRTATSRSCRSQQTFRGADQACQHVSVGNTNIPLGVEFGYNLLDPAQPYTQGNPIPTSRPRNT